MIGCSWSFILHEYTIWVTYMGRSRAEHMSNLYISPRNITRTWNILWSGKWEPKTSVPTLTATWTVQSQYMSDLSSFHFWVTKLHITVSCAHNACSPLPTDCDMRCLASTPASSIISSSRAHPQWLHLHHNHHHTLPICTHAAPHLSKSVVWSMSLSTSRSEVWAQWGHLYAVWARL